MVQLIVVLGTLVALNLGFSAAFTEKPESPEAQVGEVEVEEVKESLFPGESD
ncbi:MAG: hypothetical protein MI808_00595 [Pseudomonadales bacterium]|nr:hypothetical protein [Pseudomonadales bacterium]